MSAQDIFDLIEEKEIAFVDLRFCDTLGKEQHVSIPISAVDEDLFDGEPGKNMGIAVRDPSHGSDAGFIRDLNGNMHVIIEDWSPISANKRSWDSPLAGHAVSPNGINGFKFVAIQRITVFAIDKGLSVWRQAGCDGFIFSVRKGHGVLRHK